MNENVLLVFPSIFSRNKIDVLKSSIKNALESHKLECKDIVIDSDLVIVDIKDAVAAASVVSDLFGVDKVAVANKTSSKFTELVAAIVDAGKKIVHEGETFAVKVMANNKDYVGRDVEFAATAALIGELSKLNIKAVDEQECNKLIYVHLSKDSAYVCLFVDKGMNGLPVASQNEQLLSSLHNSLSALSCLMAVKCGFNPKLVLIKINEDNFREGAKHIELIAKRLGKKQIKLDIATFEISNSGSHLLTVERISSVLLAKLSSQYNIKNIALPFSTAIFPAWFISDIVRDVAKVATPWLPLIFMSDELYTNARMLGMKEAHLTEIDRIGRTSFDADKYAQLMKTIDLEDVIGNALKSMKTIDLEVGPNYLHDILDSI
ncbi:MAG: hypothetical protein ACE5J2_01400 [Nitrososphaerales archaeon]